MYEELIEKMDYIPVSEADLNSFFSHDAEGREMTLRDYLNECEMKRHGLTMSSLAAVTRDDEAHGLKDQDKEQNIERLVEEYLGSIPSGEVLSIIGQGTYTVDELRDEVNRKTAVGERVIQMVLDGHAFMKEAIERDKIRIS